MDFWDSWVGFFLLFSFWVGVFCDQDGFLSLSCGGRTSFNDSSNILWTPDTEYISTGTTAISYNENNSSSNVSLRFFPDSQGRRCYKLPLNNATSLVLVRAKFVYNNYDGLEHPPTFSVSLDTAIAATVNLTKDDPWIEEFLWTVNKDTLPFCLLATSNGGFPVISSLEIRPLPRGAYTNGMEDFPNKLLRKSYRIDCGYANNESIRYPLDPYDRIWEADRSFTPFHVATGFKIQLTFNQSGLMEKPPAAVLQTGRVLARRNLLTYNLPLDAFGDYYIILYFAGILPVFPSFDVFINGDIIKSNYKINSSEISAIYVTQKGISSLNITLKSISFYPQINAFEVYQMVDIPPEVSSTTVSALQVIQQSAGLDLGWQDDPCSPSTWDHVGCEGSLVTSLDLSGVNFRSITPTFGDLLDLKKLDLHNTSLAGEIQNLGSLQHLEKLNLSFNQLKSFGVELDNLVSLKILDLQNNSLQGLVPDSLGELENLHYLNLENNKLSGPLPESLNKPTIEIRTSGNLCLSFSAAVCDDGSFTPSIETPQVTIIPRRKHKTQKHLAIILSLVGGATLVLFLIFLSVILHMTKRRYEVSHTEREEIDIRNWGAAKVFSYKEIKAATGNFKEVIGRGSFGSVYHGKLPDGKSVAVKVRLDKTQLGADSFINEVHLLSKIRHQNLVSLEGFCHESKHQILVYEFLAGGSLADRLYGTNSQKRSLSWVRRLKIAVDAAKGLDYLHNGSEPRIIHRDVKCSNILLDVEMNGKVCDFGLSKQVTKADATHVTTVVKGTAGYLDPEYYSTQQLTEKSDVYSFGVVLLELICGREPLNHSGSPDSFNLVLWAKPYLQAEAFEIVDDSIKGNFDVESMRKTAYIAVKSVESDASLRPTIAEVLAELQKAYDIQLRYLESL
ncbi:hypothetical protein K1719_020971 [Acacia pycnantha]|nr:hypothetical protein K1719_020971 [Acacia pycnantha]